MPIVRVQKLDNPFAQIDRRTLEDERISWKAKGLLCYLLSKPDHWEVRVQQLIAAGPDGKAATRSGLDELIEAGYVDREQERNDDGTVGDMRYDVYERPRPEMDVTAAETPNAGDQSGSRKPASGKPGSGKPASGKPDTSNKESSKKESSKKETQRARENGDSREQHPDLPSHAPTREQVREASHRIMMPESEADKFFEHYAAEGFETRHGRPLRWQYKLQAWKRRWRQGTFSGETGAPRRSGGGGRPSGGGIKIGR